MESVAHEIILGWHLLEGGKICYQSNKEESIACVDYQNISDVSHEYKKRKEGNQTCKIILL